MPLTPAIPARQGGPPSPPLAPQKRLRRREGSLTLTDKFIDRQYNVGVEAADELPTEGRVKLCLASTFQHAEYGVGAQRCA